jgi:hypothetical protein
MNMLCCSLLEFDSGGGLIVHLFGSLQFMCFSNCLCVILTVCVGAQPVVFCLIVIIRTI